MLSIDWFSVKYISNLEYVLPSTLTNIGMWIQDQRIIWHFLFGINIAKYFAHMKYWNIAKYFAHMKYFGDNDNPGERLTGGCGTSHWSVSSAGPRSSNFIPNIVRYKIFWWRSHIIRAPRMSGRTSSRRRTPTPSLIRFAKDGMVDTVDTVHICRWLESWWKIRKSLSWSLQTRQFKGSSELASSDRGLTWTSPTQLYQASTLWHDPQRQWWSIQRWTRCPTSMSSSTPKCQMLKQK